MSTDIHKFKIALLMFLVNLKLAPETIANILRHLIMCYFALLSMGPRIWNNLNDIIVASKSMCIFKRNLKQNLVNDN